MMYYVIQNDSFRLSAVKILVLLIFYYFTLVN